jgi:hypothetical protein
MVFRGSGNDGNTKIKERSPSNIRLAVAKVERAISRLAVEEL